MEYKKPKKRRWNVTLTDTISDRIDELVSAGVFLNRGDLIRAGIRLVLEKHPKST